MIAPDRKTALCPLPGGIAGWLAVASILSAAGDSIAAHDTAADRNQTPVVRISYNQQIRPILANHCYKCHGPDEGRRKADLRLDLKSGAFGKLAEGGQAVHPGSPAKSKLWQRVSSSDADLRMPPAHFGRPLSVKQRQMLRRWIEQGAPWESHWAYTTPRRADLPTVRHGRWPQNAVDFFTLAAMERRQLAASPDAGRLTLLRRVTLDLTGLPPTPAEIEIFLRDRSPQAYEKAVDRLLQSPRFGERMAQHWLDLARYADTHGYHTDSHRDMWRYREWVISAFNRNQAFDRFTIEQLAGDLLENPTLDQLIATGFNRNNMINFENGALAKEYQTEYVIDRVNTTATVWLGQTFQCARCHDHKYDPISQRDFYRLYAYFNQVPEKGLDGEKGNAMPFVSAPTRQQAETQETLAARSAALQAALDQRSRQCDKALARWEQKLNSGETKIPAPPSDVLAYYRFDDQDSAGRDSGPSQRHAKVTPAAVLLPDRFGKALLFTGNTQVALPNWGAFRQDKPFTVSLWVMPTSNQAMSLVSRSNDARQAGLELSMKDSRVELMVRGGPEKALRIRMKQPLEKNQWQHLVAVYDGRAKAASARLYLNGRLAGVEINDDNLPSSATAVQVRSRIGRGDRPFRGMLDEVRFYARSLKPGEIGTLAAGLPVAEVLATPAKQRSQKQRAELKKYFLRRIDAPSRALRQEREEVQSLQRRLAQQIPTTMVMRDVKSPRPTFILKRGNYQFPSDRVTPGTPRMLPEFGKHPANRLGLARWLTDPRHPLTARVTVNRFWQMFFGRGLVSTPEDFGTRGQPPTHPRLLDWLAVEFIESGWNVKHMVRLMVTSATYRQSSVTRRHHVRSDPTNRWLTRATRRRLSAEAIRDGALFASGLLQERLGGRSVHPYQPPGLWREVSYNPLNYTAQVFLPGKGEDLYRRSLYTFWKRAVPPPGLVAFDAPSRETCTVRRSRTNSPLQALVLMNDPTYVEAARCLAERSLRNSDEPREALAFLFMQCLSRPPRTSEVTLLLRILEQQIHDFRAAPSQARLLIGVGDSQADRRFDACRLAAWTTIASMILSLDERINRN